MAQERIALVSMHTCPLEQPGVGDSGGMNVYVMSLARALAGLGMRCDVFTRRTDPDTPRAVLASPGVRVFHIDAGPPATVAKDEMPCLVPEFIAGVGEAAEANGISYDAVHSHYWLSARAGKFLARMWGAAHMLTFHSLAHAKNQSLAESDEPEPAHRIAGEIRAIAAADRVIASTVAEAALLVTEYGACPGKIDVVAPGVDAKLFAPGDGRSSAAHLGFERDGTLTMLVAGRIQPLKGIDVAVAAVGELQDTASLAGKVRLVVVGGPSGPNGQSEARSLAMLAEKHGVAEHVTFCDPVPQDELVEYYRAADLVLVPSRSESFGLVALEAQAAGVPVVVSSAGGLPEVVRHGETGIVVESLEPSAFADAIRPLLLDSRRREVLGIAGRKHAARFTWQSTALQVSEIYGSATRRTTYVTGGGAPGGVPGVAPGTATAAMHR